MKTENWVQKVNDNINTLKIFSKTSALKVRKALIILMRLILISQMSTIVKCTSKFGRVWEL